MKPELLTLSNIGQKGLNTDVRPWELSPEYITDGSNFRVFSGSIRTSGGWANWSTPPVDFTPGYLIHARLQNGYFWVIAGETAVYAFDGASWTDISSAGGYSGISAGDELFWTGCKLGDIPIISNPFHFPEYWSPQSVTQPMQLLQFDPVNTWQDKNFSCEVMRSHKNFLFALNLREGLETYRDGYRWSHPADLGFLPFTWDETDLSSIAGRSQLGGSGGQIMDGLTLRDSFVIYSEDAIDILDQSNDEFVWRRRELSSTYGVLSRDSVVEVKGKHFLLADGDVLMNDGNSIMSIMHNRIRSRMTSRISSEFFSRSYAVRNDALKEVWFCVPEDAEFPNTAYIYNWRDDSWAIRDIPYAYSDPNVTQGIAFANYGTKDDPADTWDTVIGTWDEQARPWGNRRLTPLNDSILGIDHKSSTIVELDPLSVGDAVDIKTRIQRTDFPLAGHKQVTTITRVYPHISGTQPVRITFGSQDNAGGSIRWRPSAEFIPGKDRKIDLRTTGELHCWRIESIGSGNWIMSGMDIEFSRAGER